MTQRELMIHLACRAEPWALDHLRGAIQSSRPWTVDICENCQVAARQIQRRFRQIKSVLEMSSFGIKTAPGA